jgi:hypothetical protein
VVRSTNIRYATPPARSSPYPFLCRHCGLSVGSIASCCHPRGSIGWNYYTIPRFYNNSANSSVVPRFAPAATLRQPRTSSPPTQITPIISIPKSGHIFTALFQHSPRLSVILVLYLFTVQLPAFSSRILNKKPSSLRDTWRYRLFSDRAYLFWAHKNWIDFDRTWLILRNEHFDITRERQSGDTTSQSFLVEPIYDAVRGLAVAVHGNEHHDNIIFAGYHCFQDLSPSALNDQPNHHLQACHRDLVPTWNSSIANIATIVADPAFDFLHDINTVLFLRLPGIFYKAINTSQIFGKHLVELHTRILGDLYARQPRRLADGTSKGPTGFFHWYTINMDALDEIPETQDGSFDTTL